MFKKLFSFALLLAVAAPMYAQLKNDGLTSVEKLELVPQTEAQADAYQAGKDAIKELLVEKAAKGEKVSQEEVVAAPMYAQLKNDGLTPVEKLELVPQTEAQADAYRAGKDAIKKLLVEKAAKGEKVSQEEVVAAVEQVYATVALRNNEKAIWFALGALSILGGFLAWKFIIVKAWESLFGNSDNKAPHVHGPDCDHDHAPAPAAQPQTRARRGAARR